MRRILHFMADIHVSSGMAAVVMNYYRHIDRSRVQFDFLCFEDGPLTYAQEIESLGGRVFLIPRPGPSSMGAIREFFREHQGEFSVLHCHPIWSAAVLEPVARRFGIRAVFLHSHSDKPGESAASILRNRLMLRMSAGKVDACLACSHAAEAALMGIPSSVHILPNAIDAHAFSFDAEARRACRNELGIGEDTPVVGNVGRMVEVKNHRFLLEAFAVVHRMHPEAILMLVGDGELRPEVTRQAERLHLSDCVRFCGVRSDVPAVLSAMDVFAFPSFYEGMPNTIIEAQATGLSCVLADTITKEADITGLLTYLPLGDAARWANELAGKCACVRRDTSEELKAAGYDIDEVCKEFVQMIFGEDA